MWRGDLPLVLFYLCFVSVLCILLLYLFGVPICGPPLLIYDLICLSKKKKWMEKDARLYLQIHNSIDREVISLINHYEFVKELMDYLEFLYSGKGNVSRIFDVCKAFHRLEKHDKSLIAHFMEFKKTYEELNMLLPFSADIKVQQTQRDQMVVMSFLASLPLEFDMAKSHILSSPEISLLQETFSLLLRTEISPSIQMSNALVSKNSNYELVK